MNADHELHPELTQIGDAVPGHHAGCGAIGVTGQPGDWLYFLEDDRACDCGGAPESLVADVRRLREALIATKQALLESPLVTPLRRERRALAIVREALSTNS